MNTTVEALKEYYEAIGGDLADIYDNICEDIPVSDYSTIPDMVQAITAVAGGGASTGGLVVEITLESDYYLNIEAKKLYDALKSSPVVFIKGDEANGYELANCSAFGYGGGIYGFVVGDIRYTAEADNERPSYMMR